jgi:putative cell wall-binding protein
MKATVLAAFKQSDWAVLASGEGFADALSAQSLAGVHRAPVVLTATNKLSPEAKEVLKELGCKHVLVVGGNAAVSEATLAEVASICGDTRRVAGADRYQTSLAIMSETAVAGGVSDTVFVATGTNFADALSAGPASWKMTSPVVLAGANKKLNDEAVFAIKANPHIRRIVLLGGDGVVSDAIKDQLGPAYQFVRLSGADRYQTSAAIASWAADQGLGWSRAHVATGTNFADALAGAASAGVNSSCLLLADSASSPTITELKKHASEVRSVTLLGGNQAVSGEVEDYLSKQIVP